MPDEDFASMSFHTAPNSKHATVLAEVHQPEEGRGPYLWPNLLEDPNTGRVSVFTATSESNSPLWTRSTKQPVTSHH